MKEVLYIILGVLAGTFSGLFGVGGGVILIPALVLIAGMTQHQAQGTSLAILLLPLGILAVMRYHQSGHVNFYVAVFVCLGFVIGGLLGAVMAESLTTVVLKKAFGIFLAAVAAHMIFSK